MVHLYLLHLKKSLPFVVPFQLTLMLLLENCPQTLIRLLTKTVYNQGMTTLRKSLAMTLEALTAFQYACYFDPVKIAELKPSAADLDNLRAFPFLNSADGSIDGLKAELPRYMALANGVSSVVNKTEWWRNHAEQLPKWSSTCKLLLLIQPSSAAANGFFFII